MAEDRVRRRLVAILAADVAGYSRLMSADEEGTLAHLKAIRTELIDPTIAEHGGRVVKLMGDGVLVEFGSAVDAVRNAVAIQRAMAEHNAGIPAQQAVALRIGVNLGDIIIDDDDIYGDGVNIAARLEGLCRPGEVYVSGSVRDQVEGKLKATFEDLGEQRLKNIDRSVRVYRVAAAEGASVAAGAVPGLGETLTLPDKPSIAVLPFQNMSGDPEQEYFSDGITEDIITALSRVRWFFVTARNSTFGYKAASPDVRQVAKDLGVRYVLEGSVRKAADRVRITAQLIDGATGNHVWAERYDRELKDIFAVQDEITETVVGAIEPALGRAEQERARHKPSHTLRAWDLCQRGMWHLNRRSKEDLDKALSLFRLAIAEAPDLAIAYAGAEEACFFQVSSGYAAAPEALRDEMLRFGRTAVELDAQDAFARFALGRALNLQGENQAAVTELEHAIRLNPSFAQAHYALGWALIWCGRPEDAIPHVETAMRLSPHDPYFGQFMVRMSEAHLFLRRPEAAVEWARKSLRQPNMQPSRWVLLAASLAHAGRTDEARQAIEALRSLNAVVDLASARDIWRIADSETLDYLLDGLRKAGLPE